MPKILSTLQNTENIEDSPYWAMGPRGKNPTCLACKHRNGKSMVFDSMKKAHLHAASSSHLLQIRAYDYRQVATSESLSANQPISSRAAGKQPIAQFSAAPSSTEPYDRTSHPLPFDSDDLLGLPNLQTDDGLSQENLSSSFAHLWKDQRKGIPFAAAFGSSAIQIHEQLRERISRGENLFSSTLSFDYSEEIPQDVDPLGVDSGGPPDADPSALPPSDLPRMGSFDSPLYPWPSRSMALTDLLFSSPRLRFSEAQKKAVLTWARELGAKEVPTLRALKKAQDAVLSDIGSPTRQCVSTNGNVFYVNDVAKAIAMDYANPMTRPKMEDYPILHGSSMSQVWNGRKMLLDLPPHFVTPTARNAGKIYWINELAQLVDNSYFIPSRFFHLVDEKDHSRRALTALGWRVDLFHVVEGSSEPQVEVPVSSFYRSYLDIQSNADEIQRRFDRSSESFANAMPHPFRKVAGDRMVYSVPLILFEDDVSGNISKQWNKHYVVYASNANLPRDMLEKEFCVRFVTSSPNAGPMELMQGVKECITKAWEAGVPAFDCKGVEEVVLRPYALFFPGDNPMQAEHCSQAGLSCNFFCRSCKVGGKRAFKETDEGYSTLFQPGVARTTEDTKANINNTLQLSQVSGAEKKVEAAVASHGTRGSLTSSAVAAVIKLGKTFRKRAKGSKSGSEATILAKLKDELKQRAPEINPLLDMPGVDIHKDTPTEILHTVLLGVVKYFWLQTIVLLKKSHSMDVFETRLASINSEGLNIPKISAKYMCAYSGSLIGKHFKTIAQIIPFIVYDLVPKDVLHAWQAIGELVVLLWHTEIPDVGKYLQELQAAIDKFLHLAAKCAPSILVSKPKFHFLVHLPEFIERFGPAIIFSTERYESFNSVFRLTCIHSNRQAPSRDSCQRMAYVDSMKHVVTGGFWYSAVHQRWVKAGSAVHELLNTAPELISLLAIPANPSSFIVGAATLFPPPKEPRKVTSTSAAPSNTQQGLQSVEGQAISSAPPESVNQQHQATDALASTYHRAKSFVLNSGEKAVIGSHEYESLKSIGRVVEIHVPKNGAMIASQVVVERMGFLGTRHPVLDLPCVELTNQQETIFPHTALHLVNLQHDCQRSGCEDFTYRQVLQERIQTQVKQAIVCHKPTAIFILNTHSLHNYRQIQDIIPGHLRGSGINLGDLSLIRKAAAQQIRREKQKTAEAKEQGEGGDESDIERNTSEDEMRANGYAFSHSRGKRTLCKRKKKGVPQRSSKGAFAFGALELGDSSESDLSPESEDQHEAYWCAHLSSFYNLLKLTESTSKR
ncbi:hypothetical protein M407DRAFT_33083 [Tulasnella calospora MUT 4182]|uniref:Uncharacterized protein n=1 Tax=Tulasnella calospora MUT 4182 TaxID=1051891 RepID=A0A0C3Q3M4_9AGAM|nr:hypothetical protein M407DRAFT_33083 [Tulasnella calospora MUT 4182]